jgi:hypothetical protein
MHSAPCILQHVWILHNNSYFPIYYKNSKFKVELQDFLEGTVHSIYGVVYGAIYRKHIRKYTWLYMGVRASPRICAIVAPPSQSLCLPILQASLKRAKQGVFGRARQIPCSQHHPQGSSHFLSEFELRVLFRRSCQWWELVKPEPSPSLQPLQFHEDEQFCIP